MSGEFSNSVEGVSGGGDGANGRGSKEADGEVDAVRGEEEDDIVFSETESEETTGKPGNYGFELGEGDGFGGISINESGFVRERGDIVEEE